MTTPAGRIALLAVAAGLATTLVACSGSDGDKPDAKGSGSTKPSSGASAGVTPGGQATAFPVANGASAEELPSLGTRTGLGYTLTLNTVQRVGPQTGLVTATLTPKESSVGQAFTEPGFTTYPNPETKKLETNYDFSAVTVTAKGDPNLYQVMRDDQQACACTKGMLTLKGGVPIGVYAYVTLPQSADTVNVTVRGMAPFTNVKVSS